MREASCTVAVVGGGTAGLALARELKRLDAGSVVVLEREAQAGGTPRHCGHYPFGILEYNRLMKGPDYARRNWEEAETAGVEIRTGTSVTKLLPGGSLEVVDNEGVYRLNAERVVLCTGVRESSRPQRFVGGDRPLGVITTGALQSSVYLKGIRPFERPVIFGSELVSFSSLQTCAHLGIKPVAMVEEEERIRARGVFTPYLWLKHVPLHVGVSNPRILGRERVEALEFTDHKGRARRIETDGIIISGRFRPEAALLHRSHLEVDGGTGGPAVDQYGRCSDPAYFSAGNLLRPAETSSWCHAEAREIAIGIAADLRQPSKSESVELHIKDNRISFVMPQSLCLTGGRAGMSNVYLGLNMPVDAKLAAYSSGRLLWSQRLRSRPVRRITIPVAKLLDAGPDGPVELTLED
ncbi:glutamate synthase subunit beta [Nitratireductor basaltis]|uniref:Glutamate synthase subunit beta n=2 Tax=Nitratireductor basaltis TaxID=472175 RepID=A0A084U8L9_9HYPH|nr:glutamate synthase subunit beta [Nitratireductor basaltis]